MSHVHFSWLHLTDLHVGMANQDWLWPTLKTLLLEDLEKMHSVAGDWDLVIFSGDLTQRGSRAEFDKLDTILSDLWGHFHKLGFSPSLFTIPGNHDVARPRLDSTVRTLKRWWEETDVQAEFFSNSSNEYRGSVDGVFSEYCSWLTGSVGKTFGLLTGQAGLLPGDQSTTIEKGELRIGLVGLNSTWLQLDGDDYEGRLHVDVKQLLAVTSQDPDQWCNQNDANLLITHHPSSWLHAQSRNHWENEINPPGRFSAHMFGHMHQPSALSAGQGGSPNQISLQGISTFGLAKSNAGFDRNHGYSIARYVPSSPALKIWPRRLYKNIGAGNNIGPEIGFPLEIDNSFTIALPRSGKKGARFSPEPSSTLSDIPHSGTLREALQDVEYSVPAQAASFKTRNVEQRAMLDALQTDRVVWLVTEWGMGEDAFLAAVRRQTPSAEAPVYRLDLSEFRNRRQLSEALKSQLNCTFERLCQLLAESGPCWLLLDNISQLPTTIEDTSNYKNDIEELAALLIDYCPKLLLILRSRRSLISSKLRTIEIKAFDEVDVRSYVRDHELGSPDLNNATAISQITRHTDGIPARIDRALSELQVVSLSDLVSADLEFSQLPSTDHSPRALVETVRDLATARDPGAQREFSLLKVLTLFPQGETLARIRRFHQTYQFFPANAASLRGRGLVDVVATPGPNLAGSDQSEKRLKVSLPVRECTWEHLDPTERFELNRRAAEIYFGANWAQGAFKPATTYIFDRPNCPSSDISNANTILIRLFKEATSLADKNLMTRVLGLANSYLRALARGDHYRSASEFCSDLLPLIPSEAFRDKIASISARYAAALRMTGDDVKAKLVIEKIIDHSFSKSEKQSLLIDLAFCHEDLKDYAAARDVAKQIIAIDPKSEVSLQAESLLIELDEDDPDRLQKLASVEARARKRDATITANNIAIIRAREGDNDAGQAREILAPIMASRNKTDSYNKLRAAIELAEISKENGDFLSEAEIIYLVGAYHFIFNERLPGLFDRCHDALWWIFEARKDYRNLLVLFRHSSLYWRLAGNENREHRYVKQLAASITKGLASQITDIGRELAYYQIRSSTVSSKNAFPNKKAN